MRRFIFLCLILICGCKAIDYEIPSKDIIKANDVFEITCIKIWIESNDSMNYSFYRYDENGNLTYDEGYTWHEPWIRAHYYYNDKEQLIKLIAFKDDSSIKEIRLLTYDKRGNRKELKRFFIPEKLTDTNNVDEHYKYENIKGFLRDSLKVYSSLYGQTFELDFSKVFSKSGRLLCTNNFSRSGIERYKYNLFGKLKSKYSEKHKEIYQYDLLNRKTQIIHSDSSRYEYKYKNNKLITKKYFNSEGKLISLDSFSYSNRLLSNKITYKYENYKFIERKLGDTSFIAEYLPILDYSVKPTIYLYKYTKRK